ncbi:hypothetical protein G5B47_09710 [Paenibacillus sp. 7124]|uniref:Uncharacterized protein n=1 Tax=Paenibacillus apii TaxID=1850370 RepID=A0A6M1PHM5_9BACL|nr:hypothetical protein [Paenibacillus apii]NGM82690.1 hypothetical protein [Paenibacillus apii]NJJ39830.1 hypothetical protein [Paenibacillus apii]
MKHLDLHFDQGAGVGQGYFIEEIPPGIDALVELKNESKDAAVQLVITRYNASTLTFDVGPHTEFAVEVGNIQTVGIFVPGTQPARGRLIIIPNFSNINLV